MGSAQIFCRGDASEMREAEPEHPVAKEFEKDLLATLLTAFTMPEHKIWNELKKLGGHHETLPGKGYTIKSADQVSSHRSHSSETNL